MSIKTIYQYEGVIPRSGKSVIEFAGIKLCHRSIKKDKSDLLVHIDSKIIVRAYPIGSDRSLVLDDLAKNIDKLEYFISHRDEFIIESRPKITKSKDNVPEVKYECYKEPSYSDKGRTKKSYNVGDIKWD